MIPLALTGEGEEGVIQRIGGLPEIRKHLENLGFVPGSTVKVIAKTGENVIVNVKEARIAVSSEMARKIYL